MKESAIERAVCEKAKANGWLVFKWASPGVRGVPDRIFFRAGRLLLVEFKAPGKKPTKLQQHTHRLMREAGFEVAIVDDREQGYALIA